MIFNFSNVPTSALQKNHEHESSIIHQLDAFHSNTIHVLSEFIAEPTKEMLDYIDPFARKYLFTQNFQTGIPKVKKTQFFVTEYHPFTLDEKLKELGAKITSYQILKYSLEILDCFFFLFKNNIVHRDVKLENIFVSEDDRIILGDFGESVKTNENHCCLKKDLRGGNQLFTAPEVMYAISRASEDEWIDFTKQYSWEVGCLIFWIAFGEFPFPDYPLGYVQIPDLIFPDSEKIPKVMKQILIHLLKDDARERIGVEQALEQFKDFYL